MRSYYVAEKYFKIPEGLDLEDETQVIEYWVKWNELNIKLVSGRMLTVEGVGWLDEMDLKYPAGDLEIMESEDAPGQDLDNEHWSKYFLFALSY